MHEKQNPPWLPEGKNQLSGGRRLTLTDRPTISSVRRDPSRKKFFLKRFDPSQCKALKSPSYHVVRASRGCVSVYQDSADLLLHFVVLPQSASYHRAPEVLERTSATQFNNAG